MRTNTIEIRRSVAVLTIAVIGVLVGIVASPLVTDSGGASAAPAVSPRASDYAIVRELQDISATLGPDAGGSIEPILRQIEKFTFNACRAIEGHPFGTCQ
ncbi:MAG TPA: hypothetical protein VJL81_11190 [Solirubrobacterales bacterium]|nr:hypothetical protein [Solirubrobacterales bacterium]